MSRNITNMANGLTREGVILKDNLMNDATSRFPETDAVLCTSSGQEIVNLKMANPCCCIELNVEYNRLF